MVSVKFENVWNLMSKYSFLVDSDSVTDDVTCAICKKLMMDSYQSDCGCQYCHQCIQEFLCGESKYCPGAKEECKEELLSLGVNLNRSVILNRKISKLKVHCPNEYCQVKEELMKMEDHLRICTIEILKCPYAVFGCESEGGPKDKVLLHLNENTFTHTHLLIEYIQNMRNESRNNETLQQKINDLKENLEIALLGISSSKEESINNKNNIDELKEKVVNLNEDVKNSKLESKFIKTKLIVTKNNIDELKEKVVNLNEDVKNSKLESKYLKAKLIDTNNEIDLIKEVVNLKEELKNSLLDCKSSKEESIIKENKIENVKNELSEVKEDLVRNKLENKSLKEELIVTKNEMEELKKEVVILKKNLKNSNSEISSMKQDSTDKVAQLNKEICLLKTEFEKNNNKMDQTSQKEASTKEKMENEKQNTVMKVLNDKNEERKNMPEEKCKKMNFLLNRSPIELKRILNVDFVWRIEEISKKRNEKNLSFPFFANNYRLCLFLYIFDSGSIMLGVYVRKGINDHHLEWPLKRTMKISLLYEDSLGSIDTLTLCHDTHKSNKEEFLRPKTEWNSLIAGNLSVNYDSFEGFHYDITRDSLLISFVFSP